MDVDTLIYAKWIIPLDSNERVLENHAVIFNDGKILDLLPADIAAEKYNAFEVQQLENHALIPGLINAHTHSAMTLFRGLADDLPLSDWLYNRIWPAEQKWVSPGFVEAGARLAVAEMLRSGTTCFNDMYFFPDRIIEVACETGIRMCAGLILIDFPTPWAKDAEDYIIKGEEIHDNYKHNSLISTAFAPHSPYTVSDQPLRKVNTLAEELDIPIHMHVHETADEIDRSLEQHGKRPIKRLHELGLLSQRLLCVHMTHVEADEIELLARYGVNVVHCPESNLKLASGFCPVHELQLAGINVAIGTDGAASNNDLDMLGEIRTTALLGKGIANDSSALSAFTVLKMATINAARALGLDDSIGTLTIGKEADAVAIHLDEIETQPLYDPISQIVYATGRNQVTDVWIAGKQLLKNRDLLTIDERQVKSNAAEWGRKLGVY